MRQLIAFVLMVGGIALAEDEVSMPAADDWYATQYAPLYHDKPWEKAAEIAGHFAENVHVHGEGAGTYSSLQWMSEALEEWKIDGWVRSELADLDFELLNETTASFKAKWRDYYTGGNISYECGWYLADLVDGKWLITEYATIVCGEHGL
ncbi:MAG: hypothetical protein KJP17_06210 [Gammaproteobacteria bacterium]|nr:hypothetical protein [Gammaproteobacteria bacterium]